MKNIKLLVDEDFVTMDNIDSLVDRLVPILVANEGAKRVVINLMLNMSRLKFVLYDASKDMLPYIVSFMKKVSVMNKRSECFSHNMDHSISMYQFLNKNHHAGMVRL